MRYSLRKDDQGFRFVDRDFGEIRGAGADLEVSLTEPPRVGAAHQGAISHALAHPFSSPRLSELAVGKKAVAIVTSDATRSVPCAALLDEVVPELLAAGVERTNLTVVVAVGAHRPATRMEQAAFLGRWHGQIRIESHDGFNHEDLVAVGRTSGGNEVFINRHVAQADLKIAFGQVEPHEFAGFSGGPKSILAGVSGEETIRRNHSPQMLSSPFARPGVTVGNPIWEEMLEAAELARLDFIVNIVLNGGLEIAGVAAGNLRAAHRAAVDLYRRAYAIELPKRGATDLIVTTPGSPLDLNLYQCIKALVAVQEIVRPGGVVVLYGPCQEGVGGEDFALPFHDAPDPAAVLARLSDANYYRAPMDHALFLSAMQVKRGLRFVLCTPGVGADIVASMFCRPAPDLQSAYGQALELLRAEGTGQVRVTFFPEPQKVVATTASPPSFNH